MENVVIAGVLVACCLLSILLTAVRMPGTWLIVAAALGYGWWTGWDPIGWGVIAVLAGIALAAEAVEIVMSVVTAKKAGASRQAAWGGLIGGFAGMIFLASLFSLPFPVIGTMVGASVGALVGCFAGAMIAELAVRKKLVQGTKVGFFSALGFALGTATKTAIALAMSGLLLTFAVCSRPPQALDADEPKEELSARSINPCGTGFEPVKEHGFQTRATLLEIAC